jgi:HlyD family secretion protein
MRRTLLTIATGLLTLSLAGCGGSTEETATPEAASEVASLISVTGEVVPAAWANVSVQTGGTVVAVLVEEGDEVAAGDLLIRLDPTDAILAVQQAEAAVETAQAQLALLKAGPLPEEIAAAEARVEAAEAALSQAAAERNQLTAGVTEADIAAAEAEVADAEAVHRAALIHYDKVRAEDADDWVVDEAALRLRAAEQAVEAAQIQLAQVQGSAGARVREANAAVAAAEAQRNVAQARLELLRAEAIAEEIAVAQADVTLAQAALDAALVALERTELHAPFDGTVGTVDVRVGELVAPGDPLLTLGDLSTLRVETTDLDEKDVTKVTVGQQVTVTFDALAGRFFAGRVTRISPMADPSVGGVNYTVVVELDEIAPAVRWGMTAFVDIEAEN